MFSKSSPMSGSSRPSSPPRVSRMTTHRSSARPSLLVRLALVLGLAVGLAAVRPAQAQPAPTPAEVGSAAPAAGTAAPAATEAGSAAAAPAPAAPAPAIPSTADMRQVCAQALNADHTFAMSIIGTLIAQLKARPEMFRDSAEAQALLAIVSESTLLQHEQAAQAIAKNERHVIMAYAAMWVLAALFVLFLWSRQRHLKTEIAQLRRDLEAAAK